MKILSKKFSQTFTSSGRRSNMKFNVTLNSAENDWEESWKTDGWMMANYYYAKPWNARWLAFFQWCLSKTILSIEMVQRKIENILLWSDIWSLHGFGSTAQTETDPIVTIENHQSLLFEKTLQIYRISSFLIYLNDFI